MYQNIPVSNFLHMETAVFFKRRKRLIGLGISVRSDPLHRLRPPFSPRPISQHRPPGYGAAQYPHRDAPHSMDR